ncbi:DUF5058 family protein [Treponema pedis]|uniref:DUF5058 domain-containing protein n=2 Tax=Treponema pedis TaxID=409322 RepID=S5ZKT9_9SPIR|nr:DUF5058 family protein [Treponema pedis]AGT43172.1 hypothetical protein TPE_0676 [Treponema pedis str. T A4]QOW60742.1 DUF5058 family protein [Treponema pedis]QSI04012.1 DUF5058 family protein [Treponema pedis]
MSDYLNIANSQMLWLSCMPLLAAVLFQAVIFGKKAKDSAEIVGLSNSEVKKAFRIGMTASIGPALGVFIVMLGLMSVIGAPLAWMRLSIIGAASTELAAAQMAAQAQGIDLSNPSYSLINFANATWVMALNGSAWLFMSGLFADKMDKLTNKISGGDSAKIAILMIGAMCGAFGFLFSNEITKALKVVEKKNYPAIAAAISAAVFMIAFEKLGNKFPKLKEYNLGIVMVLAMITAMIVKDFILK